MERYVENFNDEYIEILRNKILFSGLSDDEIRSFMYYAKPIFIKIIKGQSMRLEKEYSHMIGLIIAGRTHIYSVDYDGNKSLLRSMQDGESSGMLYSMLDYRNTLIEFSASTDSEMILFDPETIFVAEESCICAQQKILTNMIASQRELFLSMTKHLMCLSQRTIRDKLLCFIRQCTEQYRSYEFKIPFSRDDLADYLAVDRASLSRSLSVLKKEGIIDYSKSSFKVLTTKYFKF